MPVLYSCLTPRRQNNINVTSRYSVGNGNLAKTLQNTPVIHVVHGARVYISKAQAFNMFISSLK